MAHCKRCDRFSYFEMDDSVCGACRQRDAKVAALKKKYRRIRSNPNRTLGTTWDVIQLRWRQKLSVAECAEVLGISVEAVEMHIETARQDAR